MKNRKKPPKTEKNHEIAETQRHIMVSTKTFQNRGVKNPENS
jgi:hypothetical protein